MNGDQITGTGNTEVATPITASDAKAVVFPPQPLAALVVRLATDLDPATSFPTAGTIRYAG